MSALTQLKVDVSIPDDIAPYLCLVRISDLAKALAVIEAAQARFNIRNRVTYMALEQALTEITKED